MTKCGVFPGSYISIFSPNTGKYRPEKTPYLDTFHKVIKLLHNAKIFMKVERICNSENKQETMSVLCFAFSILNPFLSVYIQKYKTCR